MVFFELLRVLRAILLFPKNDCLLKKPPPPFKKKHNNPYLTHTLIRRIYICWVGFLSNW